MPGDRPVCGSARTALGATTRVAASDAGGLGRRVLRCGRVHVHFPLASSACTPGPLPVAWQPGKGPAAKERARDERSLIRGSPDPF